MTLLPLIEAKRDGLSLSVRQMQDLVKAVVAGELPDYQLAAFLMAVFFRGLSADETRALTLAMRDSGAVLRFPPDARPLVDKHSTGGVGDKVSLPLAPLLACLGFRVPMISGRGLGVTGGTLDKLESIPGFTTALPVGRIADAVQRVGCVICGQTESMVPADKRLYALRDVTGTVPSLPLIVASILSKKLAESLDALVLDVKFGAAAFMRTPDQARELAQAMVTFGGECGVNTRALLTDMNTPLGRAAGNWLEVKETVDCLEGRGPDDLRELVIECAAHLLVQTGCVQTRRPAAPPAVAPPTTTPPPASPPPSPPSRQGVGGRGQSSPDALPESAWQDSEDSSLVPARARAAACLASGAPRRKWDEMLVAQGVDLDAFNQKLALNHPATVVAEVPAPRAGFVTRCDARLVGELIRDLGGGRLTKDSRIHPDVGVDRLVKPGERIAAGAPLARVHLADAATAADAVKRLSAAFDLGDEPPAPRPLIAEIVRA